MKILVADDSKTNLMIISDSLQRLGHEAITASSGEEAIQHYQRERPDLIILDVVMPGMNGFECAKKIRDTNDEEWIPIIFLSSSVDDSSIAKGINAGGDDYIAKPFSEITLEAKIKAMQRIAEMRNKLYKTTQELLILSTTDSLTGAFNRFQFEKFLKEKIIEADKKQHVLTLMFIDIDDFKVINDTIGHHIGDLLLKEVTARIKECVRSEDFVARIGGDEFVIILSNAEYPTIGNIIATEIIKKISQPFNLENHLIQISCSIGIAKYPDNKTNEESFVQNADIAMYHAKFLGKNTFQFFSEELDNKYRRQVSLEQDLKFALEHQEFLITYQPIYQLATEQVTGMEAKVYWKHPQYGFITPEVFMPIAEEYGQVSEIGVWTLYKSCMQAALLYQAGYHDFKIYVSISAYQFIQDDFFASIKEILRETELPPQNLVLQLTENSVISYIKYLKQALKNISELGVNIAIDDFGVHYTSLTLLGDFPFNILKMDKEFLNDINPQGKNCIIVKSLITLGSNLNLNVIAEGIQSKEQLEFLIANGCVQGEGAYLHEPCSIEDITKLLKENSTIASKG